MNETEYQIIEDCPNFMYGCCQKYLDGDCSAHKCDLKIIRELEQKLQAKEQEYEELRQYHNKCCKENAEKLEQWLEKYNQVSKDFYNGKYCNKENCNLLKTKEQECEELKKQLEQQEALTETYKACYRAKHNDVKDELIKYKRSLDEIEKYFKSKDKRQTSLFNIFVIEQEILDIIKKTKEK